MKFLLTLMLAVMPFTAYAHDVHFTWTRSPSIDVQGYILECKSGLSGVYNEVKRVAGNETSHMNIPSTLATPLCWQVRMYNELGVSKPSNEICLNLPTAPTSFSISTKGPSLTEPRISVRSQVKTVK